MCSEVRGERMAITLLLLVCKRIIVPVSQCVCEDWDMAQLAEHLVSMHEALGFIWSREYPGHGAAHL